MHSIKLFIILILLTCIIILFISWKSQPMVSTPIKETAVADTTIGFSPKPLLLTSDSGRMAITLNTGKNSVRFVQIRATYNPKHLSAVKISQGDFMKNAIVLQNSVQEETGTITYMIELPKNDKDVQGKGTIATLTFTSLLESNEYTLVRFAKETLVTNNEYPGTLVKKMNEGKVEKP